MMQMLAWTKRDGLVKLWHTERSPKISFAARSKLVEPLEISGSISNFFFRDNKEARALQLDHDLRPKEIGDLSIQTYCQLIKSIADLLANVDASVTDRTLVTYMLNGLSDKYENIINVVKNRQPFPTFDKARSMLVQEEDRLNKGRKSSVVHKDTSSAAKVLVATSNTAEQRSQQHPQLGTTTIGGGADQTVAEDVATTIKDLQYNNGMHLSGPTITQCGHLRNTLSNMLLGHTLDHSSSCNLGFWDHGPQFKMQQLKDLHSSS